MTDMIDRCIKADKNMETIPRYRGTPLALKTFFMSLPYISSRDGGRPMRAPVDTPMTVMDGIRVSRDSGIMAVKIPPMTIKNRSGTI